MVVFKAAVVGIENLRLREIQQGFNRLPLRNWRGEFFSLFAESFAQLVGVAPLIEIGRRLNLIFQIKSQLVKVVNVR